MRNSRIMEGLVVVKRPVGDGKAEHVNCNMMHTKNDLEYYTVLVLES